MRGLLHWIDQADQAAQQGRPRPELLRPDGQPLFPNDQSWWLTDLERRNPDSTMAPDDLEEARLDDAGATLLLPW